MDQKTQKIINRLDELVNELENVRAITDDDINVFTEVGLGHHEIRHSTFLARLLDPSKPHGLGNLMLKKLCEALPNYKTTVQDLPSNYQRNELILSRISQSEMDAFVSSDDIVVMTERVGDENNSRIDILLTSESAETVLVIENKVFSKTHDDQLQQYEKKFAKYLNWKKIFIYLTPYGELPLNLDESYNENWCQFDYKQIYITIREILMELKRRDTALNVSGKQKAKIKILLEDYMKTVDMHILKGNMKLMQKCKKIHQEYEKELEILFNYSDNTLDALELCRGWLLGKGVKLYKSNKTAAARILAYNDGIEFFFKKHGEVLGKTACYYLAQVNGPNLEIYIELEKGKNASDWSMAQRKILEHFSSDDGWKKTGYYKLGKYANTLLSIEERCEALEDEDGNDTDLKNKLKDRLEKFVDNTLADFEKILQTL